MRREHLVVRLLEFRRVDVAKAPLRVLGSIEERIPRKARERLLRQESSAVERAGTAEGRADDTLHPRSENKGRTSSAPVEV